MKKWIAYNMSKRKNKQGIIALSSDKDCTFENLSGISNLHSNSHILKGSCYAIEHYHLSSKYSLWYLTFKFTLLDFTPIAQSNRIFSYLHSHLELVKHYHFVSILTYFFKFMFLYFWLKIIQLVLFFLYEDTRLKAD